MLVHAWLRLELRRRWRALLVLALLVAISTATVLTAAAGALRGASAMDRLLAGSFPATAVVSPFQPGFDWDAVRALPEVEALTTYPYYSDFTIDEVPGFPSVPPYLPADREAMHAIETPAVLAGRLADPARPDEAVVTASFAEHYGIGVGAVVTLRLYTPQELDIHRAARCKRVGPQRAGRGGAGRRGRPLAVAERRAGQCGHADPVGRDARPVPGEPAGQCGRSAAQRPGPAPERGRRSRGVPRRARAGQRATPSTTSTTTARGSRRGATISCSPGSSSTGHCSCYVPAPTREPRSRGCGRQVRRQVEDRAS